jgi:hypothetical protein
MFILSILIQFQLLLGKTIKIQFAHVFIAPCIILLKSASYHHNKYKNKFKRNAL